jgi:hypothetical protein
MPGREDDAASGVFTYDGSTTQNSMITSATGESGSFAAKVAAENERVAREYDLPLGSYGLRSPPSTTGSFTTGSVQTEDVASNFSGIFDNDDNSFLRNVSADAAFKAQAREEVRERQRSPANSKGEDTKGMDGLIGSYAIPVPIAPENPGSRTNGSREGNLMTSIRAGVMNTMVSLGLAWGNPRPSTPQTSGEVSPAGSHEEESVGPSVSHLSFDGKEVNSTASASKSPLSRLMAINNRQSTRARHGFATEERVEKAAMISPKRLIPICSAVIFISIALAVGGWVVLSRQGDPSTTAEAQQIPGSGLTDDEVLVATAVPTSAPTPSPVSPSPPSTQGETCEDSLTATFLISGMSYDCIWFSQRSSAYRSVMCTSQEDIFNACQLACGNCDHTALPTSAPTTGTEELIETTEPAMIPSIAPTRAPTRTPTILPSVASSALVVAATSSPVAPTGPPVSLLTSAPTFVTQAPVAAPTAQPVAFPTTRAPIAAPTSAPFAAPTDQPIATPTRAPFAAPTGAPFAEPTDQPIATPTRAPFAAPTGAPFAEPTAQPFAAPTGAPFAAPTTFPIATPTRAPVPRAECTDNEGDIPLSSTSCEEFNRFTEEFRAQRCRTGFPVFEHCRETCDNCEIP